MNQEDYNKLQQELSLHKSQKDSVNTKAFDLLTAGKAIANNKVSFELANGVVKFDTISFIPKDTKDKFLNALQKAEDDADVDSLDTVYLAYADLMSDVCLDESLKDPEVWIRFNEECGGLTSLAQSVFKELTLTDVEIKSFRRK